jgi:hypothetical protein
MCGLEFDTIGYLLVGYSTPEHQQPEIEVSTKFRGYFTTPQRHSCNSF